MGLRAVGRLSSAVNGDGRPPPTKRSFEATADVGVGAHPGLIAGRKVRLLVFKKHPNWALEAPPMAMERVGWACFVAAVVAIGVALTVWPVTTFTWIVLAIGALFV